VSYKEYKPNKKIKKFIKCFWIMEREYNQDFFLGDTEYLWPSGLTEILYIKGPSFKYIEYEQETNLSNEMVIGAYNKRFVLKNNGKVKIIGIRCYNHGASILFNLDINNIKNNIEEFKLEDINKDILNSSENDKIVKYLNMYCEKLIKEDDFTDILYKFYKEDISIEELQKHSNLSLRQFERKIKKYTSFTPKELLKIIRFDNARKRLIFQNDYLQVMSDLGYYDYSHFSKDFKRYFEITPKKFMEIYNINKY
jgi:AraC-like DNA-binding protein